MTDDLYRQERLTLRTKHRHFALSLQLMRWTPEGWHLFDKALEQVQ
jgi:hypothetical protein